MVFGHGLGGNPADWDRLVRAFRDDYRVMTFAQAGSARAAPGLFSPTRHASPLGFADDLSLLCAELGVRDAVCVGHSLAATAGVIASVADPGLFSRLVLVNASPRYIDDPAGGYRSGFGAEDVEAILGDIRGDYDAWAAGFGPLMIGPRANPDRQAEFIDCLRGLDSQVALTAFRAVLTSDERDVYPRVGVPTLVLQSEQDPAVPMSVARWITDTIPTATLVELPCPGHFPHVVDPDAVIGAIRAFLDTPRDSL